MLVVAVEQLKVQVLLELDQQVVLVALVEEAHVLGELPLLGTSVLLVELILAVVALVAVEEEVVKPTA